MFLLSKLFYIILQLTLPNSNPEREMFKYELERDSNYRKSLQFESQVGKIKFQNRETVELRNNELFFSSCLSFY